MGSAFLHIKDYSFQVPWQTRSSMPQIKQPKSAGILKCILCVEQPIFYNNGEIVHFVEHMHAL